MHLSRRRLLATGTSILAGAVAAPLVARAQQAQWTYKYANNLPDSHPMNVRAREMAAAVKDQTGGRFEMQIFPSSQLGSDTDTLSQIRAGGVEFFTLSGLILSTLVPAASINGIGFAFPSYDGSTLPRYRLYPDNDYRPTPWITNRFGWLSPDVAVHKPPHTIRVGIIGDSTSQNTYGFYLQSFLDAWARAKGFDVRFEVLNTARQGLGFEDELRALRFELGPMGLDYVISRRFRGSF